MKLFNIKIFKKKVFKSGIKYLVRGLRKKKFLTVSATALRKKYRFIDFFRRSYISIGGYVLRIEYDPNRSAKVALICYKNGLLSYIIAPVGLKVQTFFSSGLLTPGYANALVTFKYGSFIHCVELIENYGAKVARSAGCYCIILNKMNNKLILKMPSGEHRLFNPLNWAALGIVSCIDHKYRKLKKAGRSRWFGIKPTVRGVAKNAVDHPHGGGRGKTSKLSVCSNFTKRVLKWVKLKKKKNYYIVRARKKKW